MAITAINSWRRRMVARFTLAPDDLLRDLAFRRLWISVMVSSFGAQVTMLALPLTAAVLLHATPTQMGMLTAIEILPFVLFSLPSGVWLDRVRKLPVYVGGEILMAVAVTSVPLAWKLGWLSMVWMYVVAFLIGVVYTIAGSASQIVLTHVVPRARLVEAHARNALATSGAEVAGPGLAGLLIKLVGAPLALLLDAVLLLASAAILRGAQVHEAVAPSRQPFWHDLKDGIAFVAQHKLLVALAVCVGCWQLFHHSAVVVQILLATRTLHLTEQQVGLCYVALGFGTVLASLLGHRISRRIGPGPCLTLGFAVCGLAWVLLALAPAGRYGMAAFSVTLALFGIGAVLIFINFLGLRQAVTPAPLLGRMTSTMRWLVLIPAGPGALLGGWIGEHAGLRAALAFGGCGALLLALLTWHHPTIRRVRTLPTAGEPLRSEDGAPAVAS